LYFTNLFRAFSKCVTMLMLGTHSVYIPGGLILEI
jgi:hypothetical protein